MFCFNIYLTQLVILSGTKDLACECYFCCVRNFLFDSQMLHCVQHDKEEVEQFEHLNPNRML
jgi:hypothetical protein